MSNSFSVKEVKDLNENTYILSVSRNEINVKAGQCFSLGSPGSAINREYSIYSGENDIDLKFLIKKVEDGIVSKDLYELKPKDKIELSGPFGEFCLDKKKLNEKFLFLCSGTGIAPFISYINTHDLNYTIVHGVRYDKERFDNQDILKKNYVPCVSRENTTQYKRVTDYIKKNNIDENMHIYLCGNRNMIIDSVNLLNQKGNYKNIFMEVFF